MAEQSKDNVVDITSHRKFMVKPGHNGGDQFPINSGIRSTHKDDAPWIASELQKFAHSKDVEKQRQVAAIQKSLEENGVQKEQALLSPEDTKSQLNRKTKSPTPEKPANDNEEEGKPPSGER